MNDNIQTLKFNVPKEDKGMAEKYFSVMSILNDWNLTNREIEVMVFTAINKNINSNRLKTMFAKEYGTTLPTINNTISKLRKRFLLMKTKKFIHVNPMLLKLDFNKDIMLIVTLKNEIENSNGNKNEGKE